MKNAAMNGKWEWFRKDGSIMRAGEFRAGQQCGTWSTFTADGRLVTEKTLN
jgi:antitoxin component YwqK of YwqJK toxin-antitoxin module